MSSTRESNVEPLSPPVFYILLALGDDSRHGYDIMKEVADRTHGTVRLLPGSLYSTIRRMLDAGLIIERDTPGEDVDQRRRYYELTAEGRAAAEHEAERMRVLLDFAAANQLTPAPQPPGSA